MAWLRVDDGFTENAKIAELTDREFRIWIRTLCYAARNNGKRGRLTPAMRREIVGLSPGLVSKLKRLGLLDTDDDPGVLSIHDWDTYNPKDPSHAARQARYRGRQSDDPRDGLSDVEGDAPRDADSDAPRAGTRARPVPSPSPEHRTLSEGSSHPDPEREIHDSDNDRWQAWQTYAETAPGIRSPAAYARSGYDTGDWPPEDQPDISKVTVKYEHECPGCGLGLKTAVALADHIHVIHPELERATA